MNTTRLSRPRFVVLFVLLFAALYAGSTLHAQYPSNATGFYTNALNVTGGSSVFGSAGIYGVAVDPTGTYAYVGDYTNKEIWQYTIAGGTATSAVVWMPNNASTASTSCSTLTTAYGSHGDGCPYADASGVGPRGLFVDVYGNIIITDYSNHIVHVVYAGGTNNPMAQTIYAANAPLYSVKVNSSTAPVQAGYMYMLAGGVTTTPAKGAYCNGTSGTTAINAISDGCQGTQIALGASGPRSATADIYGNVYISDWGNNVTRMVVANAMTVQGYSLPAGAITTIGGGATANTAYGVNCGSYNGISNTASSLDNVSDGCWGVQATYANSGTNYHWGVAVDTNANVYVNDGYQTAVSGTGLIRKLTPSALPVANATVNYTISTVVGMPVGASPANALCSSTASQDSYGDGCAANSVSLGNPRGITVDASGNLYFDDYSNGAVRRYDATLGIVTLVGGYKNWVLAASGADCNTIVATGVTATDAKGGNCPGQFLTMSNPNGSLGVDQYGNVYAGDSGNNLLRIFKPNNNFGTVAVGGTPVTKTIDVHYLSNVVPASLTAPQIQSSSPDFTVAMPTGGSCFTNNTTQNPSTVKYAFSATVTDCVVKVTFNPTKPGLRTATLQAVDSNSNIINITPGLVGYATGPALTIDPGGVTTLGTGLSAPQGVALDAAGDLFIADTGNNQVVEIPATSTQTTILNTLNSPKGVAVATNGDLYVADTGNNRVVRIPLINGVYTPASLTVIGSGLSAPQSLVFDSLGNLYIADAGNHRVLKMSAVAGFPSASFATTVYPASTNSSSTPLQLAIDASDNLYIADTGLGNVYVVNTATLATTTGPAITGLSIGGLAVDAGANLYYSNVTGATVSLLHATTYANSTPVVASGGSVTGPYAIAIDGTGNLYVADAGTSAVYKYQRTSAALGFGIVTVGNSTASQTIYVNSTGNGSTSLSVTGTSASDSTDFTVAGSGSNPCASSFPYTIADGVYCTLSGTFKPSTSGALTDAVTVSSNAVNASSPSYTLSGTGASQTKATSTTTVSFTPTSATYGTSLSATIAVTGSGGTPSGQVSYTIDGGSATVATLTGSGTYVVSLGVLTAGLHSVAVSYSGDSFFTTSTGSNGITIAQALPTITWTPSVNTQIYGTAIGSGVLDASGSVTGNVVYTATPSGGSATTITSVSILAVGTYTLTATFMPKDITDYSTPAAKTTSYTVTQATPTISWIPSSNTQVFGSAIGSAVLNATSATAGSITYMATLSGGSPVAITSATVLAYGSYTLTATLTPSDWQDYTTATATQSYAVTQASSSITIAASSSSVSNGTAVKLTATVQVNGLAATKGEVRFLDGTNLLPKVQVVGASPASGQTTGNAVLNVILGPGSHSLSAKYIGPYGVKNSTTVTPAAVTITGTTNSAITLSAVSDSGTPQNYDFSVSVLGGGTASETATATLVDTTASNNTIGSFTLSGATLTPGAAASGSITLPVTPSFGLSADLNSDGYNDFVFISSATNKFVVMLSGSGTPTPVSTTMTTGHLPSVVAAADVNGDGNIDLVLAGNGFIDVYLGKGDGTFTAGSSYTYSSTPVGIALGDFNQDGIRDLALVNATGTVSVYLGNGDGTFGTATTYSTLSSVSGLVATDLAGNNAPALITLSSSLSQLNVLQNPANGTAVFTAGQTLTLSLPPVSVAAGDVNGDGFNDMVVGTGSTTGLVLLNNGSGTLAQSGTVTFPKSVSRVALTDINGDGILDIAGVGQDTSNNDAISVLLGKGDGTFPTALNSVALGTSLNPVALFAVDVNADGVPDMAVLYGNATAQAYFTATVATSSITNLGISGTGTHVVEAKYPGDSHYSSSVSNTVNVTAHSVTTPTITWAPTNSIVYGNSLSGILNATTVGSIAGSYAYTATLSGGSAVAVTSATVLAAGSYTLGVTFSPSDTTDYNSATASVSFTVTKAAATINIASASKAYGATLPTFSTSGVTGLVNGDTVGTTLTVTLSTTATASSPVLTGGYAITGAVTGSSAGNYTFTINSGTLTINKVALTVNVANATKVYGAALPTFSTSSVVGLVNGDTVGTTITITFGTSVLTSTPVGNSYSVFATVGGTAAGNYTSTVNNGTLTVTPAAASITVNASSKIYGAALPTFSATSSGLVNGDTIGTTIVVSYSTTASSASSVGSYLVTPVVTGTAAGNYNFTLNAGTLTVSGIPATITVANSTKVYGAALPTFTSSASGLQNGDTLGGTLTVSYTTAVSASSAVGSYPVSATITGSSAGNYNFTITAGTLSVTVAPLTVTIANASKNYGAALPSFSASTTGLVNGDTLSTTLGLSYSTTANPQVAVGTYPITATLSGAAAGNYSATITPGTLTVNTVPLTLSVNSASRLYGATNPSFSATASGLVNGDTVGSTVTLGYSTTATTTSAPGTYPISAAAAGSSSSNYTIVLNAGTLTVTQAATTSTITSSVSTTPLGGSVTFTVQVRSTTSGVPTGMAKVYNGTTLLGTGTLSSGSTTVTSTALPTGADSVTAVYGGDTDFLTSTSSAITVSSLPPADFSLTATPSNITIAQGLTGNVLITLTPIYGYTGTVNFNCGTLPAFISCTFTPASLTANGSTASQALLVVNTAAASASNRHPFGTHGLVAAALFLLPAGAGILLMAIIRRKRLGALRQLAVWMLLLAGVAGISACGSKTNGVAGVGMDTLTVTATGATGGVTHSLNLTININQN
jgi:hypothetical protein